MCYYPQWHSPKGFTAFEQAPRNTNFVHVGSHDYFPLYSLDCSTYCETHFRVTNHKLTRAIGIGFIIIQFGVIKYRMRIIVLKICFSYKIKLATLKQILNINLQSDPLNSTCRVRGGRMSHLPAIWLKFSYKCLIIQ